MRDRSAPPAAGSAQTVARLQSATRDLESALHLLAAILRETLTAAGKRLPVPGDPAAAEALLQAWLGGDEDLLFRRIPLPGSPPREALLAYIDGLVDDRSVGELSLASLSDLDRWKPVTAGGETRPATAVIASPHAVRIRHVGEAVDALLRGAALLVVEGAEGALAIIEPGWAKRAVSEPEVESVVRGPREGFTEDLRTNISLLRRRLRTSDLRLEGRQVGRRYPSRCVVAYLEGVADPHLVVEVHRRLDRVDANAVLDSGYLEEFLEDNPWSPFPQVQNTERPDTVAAQLLEGRIAVLVDGSPFALIVPALFFQFLQASEDYYERFLVASTLRWLRYALFLASLFLPALFVAVVTHHPEMLPTPFLLTVMGAREAVPFPVALEVFAMELSLEALREAGLRLPRPTGQAVSIVGAVILGLAGVQAGFVAAPTVILVAVTGIASFSAPRYSFALAARSLRFVFLIAASVLGLFGFMVMSVVILLHLCRLRSVGIPYLSPVTPRSLQAQADILARRPHRTRPLALRWPGLWQ